MRVNDVLLVCGAAMWLGCGGGDGRDEQSASGTEVTSTLPTLTDSTSPAGTDTSVSDSEVDTLPPTSTTNPDPTIDDTTTTTSTPTTLDTDPVDDTTTTTTNPSDDTTTSTTDDPPPPNCDTIKVTYRDQKAMHPDFGCHFSGNMAYTGLVLPQIGGDMKPQYNPNPPPPPPNYAGTPTQITSAETYYQWYNTVADVNVEIQGELPLTELQPGIYSFESNSFYPLTDQGFGNNVDPNWSGETFPDRNGSFTSEIHSTFTYKPGQQFSFQGDDDVWVFINGQLAMDLGGLHGPVMGTINLDTLGLTSGQSYTIDVFHAERCESGSNFRIDTSIACFIPM